MRVDQILSYVVGPDVLDVGCAGHQVEPGDARWLHGRLRERFRVTGIDVSQVNIDRMRGIGFNEIHVQSAEDFAFNSSYDTIVAGELVEHVSNPGRFLACCYRHLRPEGKLVISTPYVFSLMYALYALDHYPRTCENHEHTCWFCPATFAELAKREGFQVEQWVLVDDFSERVASLKYRVYWALIRTLRWLLPDRMTKTNMIFVLKKSE